MPILKKGKLTKMGMLSKIIYQVKSLPFSEENRKELQKKFSTCLLEYNKHYRQTENFKRQNRGPKTSGGLGIIDIDMMNKMFIADIVFLQLHKTYEEEFGYSLAKQKKQVFFKNG